MSSPLIILLALALWGFVHSLLASLRVKRLVRRRLGDLARRSYRLAYNVFAGASLLPVLALVGLLPDRRLYTIAFPWLLMTAALQGLAFLALLIGLLQTGVSSFLGLSQLLSPTNGEHSELVLHGFYRWVRHPLYTAGLIFIWANPVMTANLLALNIGLTLYILIGAQIEERKLVQQFGETYRQYQKQTPMLFPCPLRRLGPRG